MEDTARLVQTRRQQRRDRALLALALSWVCGSLLIRTVSAGCLFTARTCVCVNTPSFEVPTSFPSSSKPSLRPPFVQRLRRAENGLVCSFQSPARVFRSLDLCARVLLNAMHYSFRTRRNGSLANHRIIYGAFVVRE